jgi:hypothetical protein
MLNSNVFIVVLLLLVRAAIYLAPQLFRVVLRIPWRGPNKDRASFPVMMGAKKLSPGVSLDLDP